MNTGNDMFLFSPFDRVMHNMNYIKRMYLDGRKLIIVNDNNEKIELYEYESEETAISGFSKIGSYLKHITVPDNKGAYDAIRDLEWRNNKND